MARHSRFGQRVSGVHPTPSQHSTLVLGSELGWHEECRTKMQTISCRREYRALLPIGRQERLFHDLLAAHSQFEGVFDSWRDRYAVSGTSVATRSKRRFSIRAQRLRGAAALLAEWFRICLRQGYMGNHTCRNEHKPTLRTNGADKLITLHLYRRTHKLDLPLGPASKTLPFRTPAHGSSPPT
jgi:hypothetical protein